MARVRLIDEPFLTRDDVAALMKVSTRTVLLREKKHGLPSFMLGGSRRFRRAAVEEWLAMWIAAGEPGQPKTLNAGAARSSRARMAVLERERAEAAQATAA